MIYTIRGSITYRDKNYFVIENNGLGFKVLSSEGTLRKLKKGDSSVQCFCFLHLREDGAELYGFLEEESLKLFEMLNSIAGIGPKTALGILDVDTVPNIMAAIIERRVDLLERASGIGRKTAERVILELHNKIKLPEAKALSKAMEENLEVEEVLVGLGYQRSVVREALAEIQGDVKTLEEKIRAALKTLSRSR